MRIFTAIVFSTLAYSPAALACGDQSCATACNMATTPADSADTSAVEGERAAFAVEGMKCGRCSAKIVAALEAVEGVKVATVDHATGDRPRRHAAADHFHRCKQCRASNQSPR